MVKGRVLSTDPNQGAASRELMRRDGVGRIKTDKLEVPLKDP